MSFFHKKQEVRVIKMEIDESTVEDAVSKIRGNVSDLQKTIKAANAAKAQLQDVIAKAENAKRRHRGGW